MPRIIHGVIAAITLLVASVAFAYVTSFIVGTLGNVIDVLDDVSQNVTRMPAKTTEVLEILSIRDLFAVAIPVFVIAAIGVMAVYFIHVKRR